MHEILLESTDRTVAAAMAAAVQIAMAHSKETDPLKLATQAGRLARMMLYEVGIETGEVDPRQVPHEREHLSPRKVPPRA